MSEELTGQRIFAGLVGLLVVLVLARQWARGGADIVASDGVGYFSYLASGWVDGDLNTRDEFLRFGRGDRNHWSIGTALTWAPFYLVGRAVSGLTGAASVDGCGLPEQLACAMGSLFLGCGALWLSYRTCRSRCGPASSLLGVAGLAAAGNLPYYMLVEPYMSHASSAFLASLFTLWLCQDAPLDAWRGLRFGTLAGLMALVRPQDGLFLALPFVQALWRRERPAKLLWPAGVAAFASFFVFNPQLAIWRQALPHGPEIVPGGAYLWLTPRLGAELLGPVEGLFLWHPVTLLAVAGLASGARSGDKTLWVMLLGFALQAWIIGAWGGQGQTFGGRMFLCCFPLFCLGLAILAERLSPPRRRLLGLAVALLAVWNLGVAVGYRSALATNPRPALWQAIEGLFRN